MAKDAAYCFSVIIVFLNLALAVYSYDCNYMVNLKTGSIDKAGTDAKVLLRLFDRQGNAVDATNLQSYGVQSKDYFERGQLDSFSIPGNCVSSPICRIELGHNNAGRHSGWFVDYLEVSTFDLRTQRSSAVSRFNINQWLATDEPPYALTAVRNQC